MSGDVDRRSRFTRHIEVIDAVNPGKRPVDLDHEVGPVQVVTQPHLARDSLEDLRQGLIDRVDADIAVDLRVDIEVQAGIACQRKKQFAGRQVGRHHGKGLHRLGRLRRGDDRHLLHHRWNIHFGLLGHR